MTGNDARRVRRMSAPAVVLTLAAALVASLAVLVALAPGADAAVNRRDVSRNPEPDFGSGLPAWYQDASGLRVAACLDDAALCALELPGTASPTFPDEVPYWAGEASMDVGEVGAGGEALLAMAVEGGVIDPATDTPAAPGSGTPVTEAGIVMRFNLTASGLRSNTVYRITYPYGVLSARTDANGEIARRLIGEAGCEVELAGQTCNFRAALQSPVFGGFLYWSGPPARPPGFLGDPEIPHRVSGSPNGTNFFRIEGPGAGGVGDNRAQTNLFNITGQVLRPFPTSIGLDVTPKQVRAGRATVLSGQLRSVLGGGLGGQRVVLLRKAAGAARFTAVPGGTRTTAADGSFRLRVKPSSNTVYRARFDGEPGAFWPSISDPERVSVIRR